MNTCKHHVNMNQSYTALFAWCFEWNVCSSIDDTKYEITYPILWDLPNHILGSLAFWAHILELWYWILVNKVTINVSNFSCLSLPNFFVYISFKCLNDVFYKCYIFLQHVTFNHILSTSLSETFSLTLFQICNTNNVLLNCTYHPVRLCTFSAWKNCT